MKYIFYVVSFLIFLITYNANCQEWTQINAQFDPPGQYHIDCAKFTDKNNGWWVSHYTSLLFRTTDGCKTFVSQTIDDSLNFACLDFFDANNGWVVAKKISNNQLYLYRTRNAGNSWTKTALLKSLFPIKFLDTLNGIGGYHPEGAIYWTDDGGITWLPAELPDLNRFQLRKCVFISETKGFAIGDDRYEKDGGLIYATEDGGRTWYQSLTFIDIAALSGIAFVDSLNGCAVSAWNYPHVYTTHDGGNTWNGYLRYGTDNLNDVAFENDSVAWAVGYNKILKSTDKGITWTRIEGILKYNYDRVIFLRSENVGYILGSSSSIFKYEMTPVSVKEDNIIKKEYVLCQNYPNPFNSTTVISYELKVKSDVRLSVFDLNGREIKTLISGHQSAGIYHVPFHAAEFASGIYCYKIEAGRFVQTKKMLLIR